ncbi:adenine phosphoribosyltransferase [Peptoniphilus sp. oral taxon 386]|uniref:adenine phosphoribosyltransferase n=1 Tax=Peptoniphilus sp. oral taxon 386 TaxID=652713 RepID=UPI0001DA9D21|nr:adenine phosphoribosyltransferase [Peptoniphilus sp. oral taxon 386]EFI42690.1 adenine phosphoribosyltransferase [Peptoniphilus sp. oral taxon 386 str. F0131]
MYLADKVRAIYDYPIDGIIFRDITTLLQDGDAFKAAIDNLISLHNNENIDIIVGVEARGFIVGAPVAYALGCGFVPVRKPGKLPSEKVSAEYSLEYGENKVEMHVDAIKKGQRVLIVDDLLATGGTSKAVIDLIEKLGGEVVALDFLIELVDLKGREKLKPYNVNSILQFEEK